MLNLLKTHFGYDKFRPMQEEIINEVLSKKDVIALMPTGGGKSLCYQLPALKLKGLTLVISPLIALMKDQVDALRANGIDGAFLNSTLSPIEQNEIMEKIINKEIKILYIAPERLSIPSFQLFLKSIKIDLIAIDEAHCISEWGHDFRPDYQNLHSLKQKFPNVPIIALTATATKNVKEDIIKQLRLEKAKQFISSFNRENLNYYVEPKNKTFNKIMNLLIKHQGESVIIYSFSRNNTEKLAKKLKDAGFNALPYHAGLPVKKRNTTQEKFTRDKINIIVATIAFGMGIDKPDVRLIIHTDLPKTLEGYYQETGRAGRDGLPSECVLFYSYGDKHKQDFFINKVEDPLEQARSREKLAQIIEFCELDSCRRKHILSYFGEKWEKENCEGCDNCLSPKEEFDATQITQKILSAILKTGERFGAVYITDILKGGKVQSIFDRGHDNLSVYGIVKDFKKNELNHIIRLLIAKGLLAKSTDQYPTIYVTNTGRQFLNDRISLNLSKVHSAVDITAKKSRESLKFDTELFEKLRELRMDLAQEKRVPPFVIFGDRALQEMSSYFPQNTEDFAKISGVGEQKLEQYGPLFLPIICEYCEENGVSTS